MPVNEDIYQTEVDFTSLALRYPDFAKKSAAFVLDPGPYADQSRLKKNQQLDFSDPESVRQLTYALLDRDFNLKINLPDDRLCPPVPNRFNYILFVQQLVDSTQESYAHEHDSEERTIGLDIGTGASSIYPLLACRQRSSWLFLATELDSKSRSFADQNIKNNGLESRIKLIDTDPHGKSLIPAHEIQQLPRIHVLLTNPPFYASQAELESLAKQKSRPPNSACTGAPVEMMCQNGEVGFVTKLIAESTASVVRNKIQWFSSMLGKLSSVNVIIDKLKDENCLNYAVTEFVQGQKTRRWCVAWSWLDLRPSQSVVRGTNAVEKKYLPFPTEFDILLEHSLQKTSSAIQTEISQLPGIEWQWDAESQTGIGNSARGDVWSRKARRRLQKITLDSNSMDLDELNSSRHSNENEEGAKVGTSFVFRITLGPLSSGHISKEVDISTTVIHLRWLRGHDSTVFESFHGWLKRKIQG